MSASYPTSVKTWTPVVDDTDRVLAAHINELYEEVIALETSVAGEVLNITSVGSLVNGATEKTTPIDADMVGLMDSEHTNVLYKLSWANIKATLKTYFDTLYNKVTVNNTLTSTSTTEALSAAQGKLLSDEILALKRTPVVSKTEDFTFTLTDEAQLVSCSSSSAIVATIPKSTTVNFPVNTEIPLLRYGTGEVTITPASGVTLNGEEVGIAIDSQYSTVMIKKMAVDEWLYVGVK